MPSDVDRFVLHCRAALPPRAAWVAPLCYPTSLAKCVLDSIWSTGVTYEAVKHVLNHYCDFRRGHGADPSGDSASDLVSAFEQAGGPAAFAEVVRNRNRVSTRPGAPLKAEVALMAADLLVEAGLLNSVDVREATKPVLDEVAAGWLALPGQRSGITWRYAQMLAGRQNIKPDRMIRRFVATALGTTEARITVQQATDLLAASALDLDVDQLTLDHTIWTYQRSIRQR